MMRILPIVAAMLLAGPAAAQATAEQADALVKAIADAGCEVTEANNSAVLASAGLAADAAEAVVAALLADGRAAVVDGALRLKTAGCN
jgi:malate/lactate dehydrogenase